MQHASCSQTASMQCFIVDSIDFHAFMPKNNLPLATFLAPIHLPMLAHTSAFGGHVCSGRGASLNCLHSRTTGSIDELVWATWCRVVNLHNVSLFQKMPHYAMLMLQSGHERHTCEAFILWHVVQTFAWTFDLYPNSATNNKNISSMHMTMEQCQSSNHPCHHVTNKHDSIPSNILTWWNQCNHVDWWYGNSFLSMHEHDLQTTWPTSQHTLACVQCSMAAKFCWSESFLAPFLFSCRQYPLGLCFVHIAWTIHQCFFIYDLLCPSSFTPASIM